MHYTTSCNTQFSAPEDERNQRPKHVELIGIIDKPLLLHLVGVNFIYINDIRSKNINNIILMNHKYVLLVMASDKECQQYRILPFSKEFSNIISSYEESSTLSFPGTLKFHYIFRKISLLKASV